MSIQDHINELNKAIRNHQLNNEGKELVINLNDLGLSLHEGFTAKEVNQAIESLTKANERALDKIKKICIDTSYYPQITSSKLYNSDRTIQTLKGISKEDEPETKPFKFKVGDKVKVITDKFYDLDSKGIEYSSLKGLTGEIVWIGGCDALRIDFNGKEIVILNTNDNEVEKVFNHIKPAPRYFQQEYEDIDGVILQDQNKCPNFIIELER